MPDKERHTQLQALYCTINFLSLIRNNGHYLLIAKGKFLKNFPIDLDKNTHSPLDIQTFLQI